MGAHVAATFAAGKAVGIGRERHRENGGAR